MTDLTPQDCKDLASLIHCLEDLLDFNDIEFETPEEYEDLMDRLIAATHERR